MWNNLRIVGMSRPRNCVDWLDWWWSSARYPFPDYEYRWFRICGIECDYRKIHRYSEE